MKLLVALLLCIAFFAAQAKNRQKRMSGGTQVGTITQFPWNAAILLKDKNENHATCSGSIIGERMVLTAASCIHNEPATNLMVVVGSEDILSNSGFSYNIVRKISTPLFRANPPKAFRFFHFQNDLAILETDCNIRFDKQVYKIDVDFSEIPTSYPDVYIMGYGRTEYGAHGILHYAEKFVWRCPGNLLCTSKNKTGHYFEADVGGPIVTIKNGKYRQIGVNLGNKPMYAFDFYSSTNKQESFIKNTIEKISRRYK